MLSALVAGLAALAQPQSATPAAPALAEKADAATLAEAIRLLDQEEFEEETLRSSEMTLELMLASVSEQIEKRTSEPVPEDLLEDLRQTVRDHSNATLRANMGYLKQEAAKIYAQEFTREELIRLRELSSDPVMVKARERTKFIQPKLMALGARTMRASESDLESKIQRLISDYVAKAQQDTES